MSSKEDVHHVVLVHGACHGAWCWYKLKPLLEAAGLRVTALDMTASGVDSTSLRDLNNFEDYTRPLLDVMESLDSSEKVILVGHSQGGLNISLAMEKFPEKIHVGVFVTAILPDPVRPPSYWPNKFLEENREEDFLDSVFTKLETSAGLRFTSMLFGPNFITSRLYSLSPPEDAELAKLLVRPSTLFLEQESWRNTFSKKGFGAVKKVYILCGEDKTIPVSSQRLMTEKCGVDEVKKMEGSDHMAMISKPHQLCHHLLQIASSLAN